MDFGSVAVVSIWSFSTFVCSGIDVHHFMDIELRQRLRVRLVVSVFFYVENLWY